VEQSFKYYGRGVDPDRKLISTGEPITQQEKNESDLRSFRQVFRSTVRKTIRSCDRNASIYNQLPPQEGAFEHLELFLESAGYKLKSIGLVVNAIGSEALFCARIAIELPSSVTKEAFSQPLAENTKTVVLVDFHFGVCHNFTTLVKKNDLIDKAMEEARKASGRDEKTLELFDPEKIIPELLKSLRAERRYRYLAPFTADVSKDAYYKTPEGFIYRIEVEGYATAEELPQHEDS
jgi:hypothetical protein